MFIKTLLLVYERIAVLLLRCYIVHEPVVSELRVVLQYCTVSDARVEQSLARVGEPSACLSPVAILTW